LVKPVEPGFRITARVGYGNHKSLEDHPQASINGLQQGKAPIIASLVRGVLGEVRMPQGAKFPELLRSKFRPSCYPLASLFFEVPFYEGCKAV
jgi:hypothetical protein